MLTVDDVAALRPDEIAVIRCDAYAHLCARLASAVVAEHASPFGSMATRARAANVPGIVGVAHATRVLRTGERLSVRCDSCAATVTRLSVSEPTTIAKPPGPNYLGKVHHLLLYEPTEECDSDVPVCRGLALQLAQAGLVARLPKGVSAAYVPIVIRGSRANGE